MYSHRNRSYYYGNEDTRHLPRDGYLESPTDNQLEMKNKYDSSDKDSEEYEDRPKSFRKLLIRFADKTSMVGVGYINSARLWYSKAIWVFLLIVAIGWMIFHLYYLIDQYTDWPKQTKVSLNFNSLALPAVTVCNMNAVRRSQLSKTSYNMQRLVSSVDPSRFKPERYIPQPPPPNNQTGGKRKKRFVEEFANTDFKNFTGTNSRDLIDDPEKKHSGVRDDLYELEETFRTLYTNEDRRTRVDVGHQIRDMLVSCSFNGYKCYAANFTLINTEEYGNCFTLQSSTFISSDPGPKKGLTLIFYTENSEYLKGISQGYGMRLQIHTQGTFPRPDQHGIFVSTSFENHIGLKLRNITRAEDPYGECEKGDGFYNNYKIKYSRTACQLVCEQIAMISSCDCFSDEYKEFFHYIGDVRKNKWCKTESDFRCIGLVKQDFDRGVRKCSCLNPCNEIQYILSPSFRQWPTTDYAMVLMQGICEKRPNVCQTVLDMKSDPRSLSANFIKVNIYFEDLNYEELTEEPEIALAQFVSDVGGSVGLWIGLSILSIFEVVQLFIEMCLYAGHKCNKKSKKKKKKKNTSKTAKNGKVIINNDRTDIDHYYNMAYRFNWENKE